VTTALTGPLLSLLDWARPPAGKPDRSRGSGADDSAMADG
jgi:hypothetical protein